MEFWEITQFEWILYFSKNCLSTLIFLEENYHSKQLLFSLLWVITQFEYFYFFRKSLKLKLNSIQLKEHYFLLKIFLNIFEQKIIFHTPFE